MDIGEIQDVTDSLALMADPALQQYAQMHKDDPYIVSLAMSESNRRKKMRAAQQGQAGQMPPPKVVDQAISAINPPPPQPQPMPQQGMPPQGAPQQPPQGMPPQGMPQAQTQLPEDQGIAQLPAPNMQGMADGGIAGYAVGGAPTPAAFGEFLRTQGVSPPDFSRLPSAAQETLKRLFSNATTGPQMPTPVPTAPAVAAAAAEQPGLPYRAGQAVAQGVKRVGEFISRGSPKLGIGLAALLTPSNEGQDTREDEILAAVRGEGYKGKPYNKEVAAALLKEMGLDPARAPDKAAPAVKPAVLPSTGADQGRGKSGGPSEKELIAAGVARDKAAALDTGIGSPSTGESRADTRGGLPTLTTATTPADAAAELNAIKSAQSPSVPTEIASALDAVGLAKRTAIDAEETQRQKDIAAMGTAFSDREARLKAKQGRVEAQEKDLGAMALMQAGFAMMSGTSPHALSNIGAGATIGLKTYQDGLEKIENAKDKLDDAFGRIEEFRRNESMLNAKDKRKYARELSDTLTDTKKAYTDVLVKDWGVKQDDARIIYSSVVAERRELNNQKFTAGENAANRASQSANARLQATRADPLALYREMGTNPTGAVAKGYGAAKEENTAPLLFAQYEKMAGDSTVVVGGSGKYLTKGEEFTAKYPNAQAYVKAYRNALGSEGTIPPAGSKDFVYIGSRPLK